MAQQEMKRLYDRVDELVRRVEALEKRSAPVVQTPPPRPPTAAPVKPAKTKD